MIVAMVPAEVVPLLFEPNRSHTSEKRGTDFRMFFLKVCTVVKLLLHLTMRSECFVLI